MNPDDGQPSSRRRCYFIAATSAVGALGLAWAAVPYLKSMLPSERAPTNLVIPPHHYVASIRIILGEDPK